MLKTLFKKNKYITVASNNMNSKENNTVSRVEEASEQKPNIPTGMWIKCEGCGQILYKKDLEEHLYSCMFCKSHFKVSARERLLMTLDKDTFIEYDREMTSKNPLDYPDYAKKIQKLREETQLNEGVVTGEGSIMGNQTVIAVMDSRFMMGSMGSVVGEKITRAIERATEKRLPIIIFTASGGARMQEGMYSLMQMAKTSAALAKHNEAGLLYITVLTNPTTGGVTASFAMLGDIILAEPGALVGFAGRRVIEQTIKQKLPEEFQKAEFLLEHGFIDKVVHRESMKETLGLLLDMHKEGV